MKAVEAQAARGDRRRDDTQRARGRRPPRVVRRSRRALGARRPRRGPDGRRRRACRRARRVRVRQDDDDPRGHGPAALLRLGRGQRVPGRYRRARPWRAERPGGALDARRDGLPGSDERDEPRVPGRQADRRPDGGARAALEGPGAAAYGGVARAGRPARRRWRGATRTSSPAACASAPSSPWRLPASPACSSPTSPPRLSTWSFRRRSATCWPSSPTPSAWRS